MGGKCGKAAFVLLSGRRRAVYCKLITDPYNFIENKYDK